MTEIIAFDSKDFERGIIRPFYTPIGCSIRIKDVDSMKSTHTQLIEKIRKDNNLKRETKCFRYYDFAKHLGRKKAIEPIREILEGLDKTIQEIDYYYILTRKDEIKIYGKGLAQDIPKNDFLKIVSPYFVLPCAWKYLENNEMPDNSVLHLDSFNCDITGCATKVLSFNPQIYFRGDQCNQAISIADIAAAFFDIEFDHRNWRINETDPSSLFPSSSFKVQFNTITTTDFHAITPLENRKIDVHNYIKHPIVFFIKEKTPDELSEIEHNEFFNRFLYQNPVLHKALNLACDLNGCIKLLEPREDLEVIKDGDILIHTGKSGLKLANFFKGYFPSSKILKVKELFNEEKCKELIEECKN